MFFWDCAVCTSVIFVLDTHSNALKREIIISKIVRFSSLYYNAEALTSLEKETFHQRAIRKVFVFEQNNWLNYLCFDSKDCSNFDRWLMDRAFQHSLFTRKLMKYNVFFMAINSSAGIMNPMCLRMTNKTVNTRWLHVCCIHFNFSFCYITVIIMSCAWIDALPGTTKALMPF